MVKASDSLNKQKGEKPTSWNPKWPWSPITAVVFTIVIYLSQYLAAFALLIYPLIRRWDKAQSSNWLTNSIAAQFTFVVLAEAVTIGLLYIFLRKYHKSFRELGWNRRPRWSDFIKAILVFFVYFVALTVVLAIVTKLVPEINVSQKQQLGFTDARAVWQLVLTFVSLVILPPFVEETVFRGFLYGSLRKKLVPIQAAVATSILFGLAHLELGSGAPPLWAAAIDVFILSLGLCFLRAQTKSLWAGVFLHMLKNTIAFLALFVFTFTI